MSLGNRGVPLSDLTRSAAVLGVVAALTLAGCSGDAGSSEEPDTPRSSASSTPKDSSAVPHVEPEPEDDVAAPGDGDDLGPDVLTLPKKERSQVTRATDDYLDEVKEKLGKPDAERKVIEYSDVTGPALETLLNTESEYDQNGWRITGRAKVVSQQVVRRTTDPKGLVLRVCVDNSGVKVVDADGKRVPNSRPTNPRTLNVLTLVPREGAWVVADERPAANPDC